MIVVKVGGSLIDIAPTILERLKSVSEKIVIVPGGGKFADLIRSIPVSEYAAHWMAILAMEQYGIYLADKSNIPITDNLREVEQTSILLPYTWLRNDDPFPPSWYVTSDTIAAWVAARSDAKLIKVTDVDGIYLDDELKHEVHAADIPRDTCVDPELPKFLLKEKLNCTIVNGRYVDRVMDVISGRSTISTSIRYEKGIART